jgi:hypothetical protein
MVGESSEQKLPGFLRVFCPSVFFFFYADYRERRKLSSGHRIARQVCGPCSAKRTQLRNSSLQAAGTAFLRWGM